MPPRYSFLASRSACGVFDLDDRQIAGARGAQQKVRALVARAAIAAPADCRLPLKQEDRHTEGKPQDEGIGGQELLPVLLIMLLGDPRAQMRDHRLERDGLDRFGKFQELGRLPLADLPDHARGRLHQDFGIGWRERQPVFEAITDRLHHGIRPVRAADQGLGLGVDRGKQFVVKAGGLFDPRGTKGFVMHTADIAAHRVEQRIRRAITVAVDPRQRPLSPLTI